MKKLDEDMSNPYINKQRKDQKHENTIVNNSEIIKDSSNCTIVKRKCGLITFHDPNPPEDTVKYLTKIIMNHLEEWKSMNPLNVKK
jgi:hypothetical protein